jgi:hypothetical protein
MLTKIINYYCESIKNEKYIIYIFIFTILLVYGISMLMLYSKFINPTKTTLEHLSFNERKKIKKYKMLAYSGIISIILGIIYSIVLIIIFRKKCNKV